MLLVLVLFAGALQFRLVPRRLRHAGCKPGAQRVLQQGLHRTQDATGVLIFVSEAEHYVEIWRTEVPNMSVMTNGRRWSSFPGQSRADGTGLSGNGNGLR